LHVRSARSPKAAPDAAASQYRVRAIFFDIRWNPCRDDPTSGACFPGTTPTIASEFVMAWIILVVAGLLEVAWAVGLKYTEGFSRLIPSVFTIASMVGSVWLLALAVRSLPLGTAYAIWTGIGAVGAFVLGIVLFGESASAARIASVTLILAGLVGLKLTAA
jgi:quaternary ammonium compound-resistance protein SugE